MTNCSSQTVVQLSDEKIFLTKTQQLFKNWLFWTEPSDDLEIY